MMDANDPVPQPQVSVVIPVFNTQQYLDESLGSIRSQTLSELQIICVDDASTDESLAVLRRHAAEDPRVLVIAREVNAGVGAARNLALRHAIGRYVYFFDSDDALDREALEGLVTMADRDKLDSLFFNARPLIDESMAPALMSHYQRQYQRKNSYISGISGSELVVQMNRHGEWKPSPCLYLSSRVFLERTRLRFSEGVLHEDNGFTMRLMLSALRVGYDPSEYFVRRVRANSITTSNISELHIRGLVIAATELAFAAGDQGVETGELADLPVAVATQAELIFYDAIRKFLLLNQEEQHKFSEWLPARPEYVFVRARLFERVELLRKEQALQSSTEEVQALSAANEAYRRSRVLRSVRRLRSFLDFRSKRTET